MHPVFKLVIAILCGILIALFVVNFVDALNAKIFPSPIMNPTVAERIKMIQESPLPMFGIILGGWILSSFFGGYAAARIASTQFKMFGALSIGFLMLLGGIVYFVTIPQPIWYTASSCISFILFSYLGGKVATLRS